MSGQVEYVLKRVKKSELYNCARVITNVNFQSTDKRLRNKWSKAPTHENMKRESVKDGTELSDKLDGLRDVTLSLWKEVKSLGATANVSRIEHSIDFYDEVRRFEVNLIERALEQTGGSQTRAAHLLGINLTTLNAKIKRYNIEIIN